MENIHDWCISRQIWWGHRIPVWYCDDCGEMSASRTDLEKCPKCGSTHIHQDEDALDTWFSSALWPFSTMGWPDNTELLKQFYPTQRACNRLRYYFLLGCAHADYGHGIYEGNSV